MRLYDINGFKMEEDGEDIEHHGVIGQKWGRRRYQNPDGTLTELGKRRLQREQDRAIRKEEKYHAKVAKQRKKDIKAQEKATKKELKQVAKEQKEQEEIIEKKNKLVSKGSMEDIYKNRNLFTDQELQQVINRQRILNQLNPEASMTKRDLQFARAQEFVDKTAKTVKMTSDLFNAYKSASNIVNNLAGKEVLPEFDLAKKQQKAKDAKAKARAETIAKMTPDQIARNYSNFTTAELEDLAKREKSKKSLNAYKEAYLNEREQQKNDSMFRGNKAYDFTATKNMLGDYGSQTYNTASGFGNKQDISKGKSAVQSLLNEPEGALMSKWSPAPSATYNVSKQSLASYDHVSKLAQGKQKFDYTERIAKELDDWADEFARESNAPKTMKDVGELTGRVMEAAKKNTDILMASIPASEANAAYITANFGSNSAAKKRTETLLSSITDDEFINAYMAPLRDEFNKWRK